MCSSPSFPSPCPGDNSKYAFLGASLQVMATRLAQKPEHRPWGQRGCQALVE